VSPVKNRAPLGDRTEMPKAIPISNGVSINVVQSALFSRQKKKLHKNQIKVLDEEIKKIVENPKIGEQKKGDLKEVWVHKFKIGPQLFLLAYGWNSTTRYLIAIHSHEGFYKNLKRYLK